MARKHKLVLSNTYGHPNIGDDAIVDSMVDNLLSVLDDVDISVLTLFPQRTQQNQPAVRAVKSGVFAGIMSTIHRICEADLLIVGGGGIIQDQTSLGNLLFHLSRPVIARLCGTPFICYAIGVGPLRTKIAAILTALVLSKAEKILVRDQLSADLLLKIGLSSSQILVTADPVLILEFPTEVPEIPVYQQLQSIRKRNSRLVGISLRPEHSSYKLIPGKVAEPDSSERFFDTFVSVAQCLIQEWDAHIVFFFMHPNQDDPLGLRLAKILDRPDRIIFISGTTLPKDMMSLVSCVDVMIGMRLHTLIFSARSAVPMIGLSYDPKVEGFMRLIGQSDYILGSDQWKFGCIMQLVERIFENKELISKKIRANLPALQAASKRNISEITKVVLE